MPRRVTLTDRQKDALLRLPTSQADLLKHYTLSDEDLGHIRLRRRAHNRFGFALQLCVLRYPGRVLAPGELIPAEVVEFIGAQLGLHADDLVDYAAREETRHEHLAELRTLYGFRTFSGRGAREMTDWLFREAEMAVSNEDIARRFVVDCRRTRTVLPATTTIERLCATALVDAERQIKTRIADRLPMPVRERLLALLEETVDDRVTRFVWLRQFEPGSNSSSANRLLDRLESLQRVDLPEDLLAGVPVHRVTRLRRQGERYYTDGMRIAATITAGSVAPSQILRKLASYPRQNELATALREVGRVERTLFMIDWILDADLQRRAQIGLNKGEAHDALKRAISFHRRGEIRHRSAEGQHYRIAGMNLLAAIIIFWNTMKLGEVVTNRKRDGKPLSPDLLAHVSPLGWEHINLTGEYRWSEP